MNGFVRQIAYAVRGLRRSPGFTLSALSILALGIGANTAIFGIVNAVLLKPLPFPNSESIVTVFHVPPPRAFPGMKIFAVSAGNYLDWRKQNTVFESMAVIGFHGFRLGGGSRPQSVLAARTEPGFFKVLQVTPEVGRGFAADECQPGRDDVIVLSHGLAVSHFGSPKNSVGRTLELDGRTHRVIGVMPQKFQVKSWFPAAVDAWVPVAWTPEEAAVRGNHNHMAIARLRDGVTVNQAQVQMNVISERLAREYPEENKGWGAVVFRLRDHLVGDVRPALLTLLGAVGFVLLIACANTANLVLARTVTRRKELAIRAALGASGGQVVRPVLYETTLLSVAGGALGLLLAQSGQSLVVGALADRMPNATEIHLDFRVLGFTLLVSVLTGLAAGLIASWRLMKADVNESLKLGLGKADSYSGGMRTRGALVVSEVALSLILLVGAGLMLRSLWALRQVNPGFVPSGVVTMSVPIPQSAKEVKRNRFYDEFLPQVQRLPGVVSAAAIDTLPLSDGGSQQPVVIEGRPAEVFALQPNVAVRQATPGYLRTMRIPLIAGRDFEEADTNPKGNRGAVLISQAMARQFWPGESPVGKRLRISFTPDILREVVGVAGDVKELGLDVLEPVSMMYLPLAQEADGDVSLVVRSGRDPSALVPAITRVLQQIDPELPVRDVASMDERLATSLSQQRFSMLLFVSLAGLAFLLAAVGIYSVLAYSVRSRVHEITVRVALGAQIRDVLQLVVTEGMKPTLLGIAIGAFGAWLLSGILSRLIFGVSATDPYTFAAVALLLASVAFVACLIPAYRATRVDPVQALRNE
ncbi:MAG TPA: ABC transporter permease [Bryobacteraceae bacterium]|nr:ABC transporter permease [Bryobacteraceae bacterium]